MLILLKRTNGETTPFRNAKFIPAFYFIPKSMIDKCGAEIKSIPHNPKKLLHDWNTIATVESDLFKLVIVDAYAYMVWPFMGLNGKLEAYSGYEPSWLFAHAAPYWICAMQDADIIPTPQLLLKDGGADQNFGYVSEEEITGIFDWLVPQTMEQHNMNAIIETANEFRCFEDFDERYSTQKVDFYRKWYHTRTRHPMISLEGYQEQYAETHDGQEWDISDDAVDIESSVTSKVQVEQFTATLTDKDKQILEMRMEGATLEEIAKKLGYQNHSGVLKRIRRIGLEYEMFSGDDLGFMDKNII